MKTMMPELPVYLDNNATTPCDPRVVDAMIPFFTSNFGNAASKHHSFGWQAEEAVKHAREQVAQLIGSIQEEIIFTSGATESVNLAIKGVFETYASKGQHIITCVTEHKAVLDSCRHLEKNGADVTYLLVDHKGHVDLATLESSIRPDTILIALMYANNETGVVMPVDEISAIARKHGVLFFTDASQAVGKIPVDVQKDGIDLMAMTAHKIYGPKGVGALFVRRKNPRVKLTAQMDGGGHERGLRSGTLNVPGIVGFGKACELCVNEMTGDAKRLSFLRDKLEASLLTLEDVYINGDLQNRLPYMTNLSFKGIEGQALLMALNKDIALSSGSACTSASLEPSHVMKALGLEDDLAHSSLRFGLGRFTKEPEIEYAVTKVSEAVKKLRALNPFFDGNKEVIVSGSVSTGEKKY
jgi:cysteine desulfurase